MTEALGAALRGAQQAAVTGWAWSGEEWWLLAASLGVGISRRSFRPGGLPQRRGPGTGRGVESLAMFSRTVMLALCLSVPAFAVAQAPQPGCTPDAFKPLPERQDVVSWKLLGRSSW
jgi:hypothetical protein